jgi:hypothetical protein
MRTHEMKNFKLIEEDGEEGLIWMAAVRMFDI